VPQARAYSLRVPGRKVGQTSGASLCFSEICLQVPNGVNKLCRAWVNMWVSEWQSRATNGVVMLKVVVAQDNWEGNREAARRRGGWATLVQGDM
jgi:triphosphoribosyl-dephospho-CoA synthetase